MRSVRPSVAAPHLLDPFDQERGEGVGVTLDVESSTVTLAVHGRWGNDLRRDVHTALRKSLSEHPHHLFIDLQDLQDPHAASVGTWLAARRRCAGLNPGVLVTLCTAADTALTARLFRTGANRFLRIFPDLAQARAAVVDTPLPDRIYLPLDAVPGSAARARAAVTDACASWQLPNLHDRARLVASELVTNAITHAGTPLALVVAHRGDALQVIVRDGVAVLPRRPELPATWPGPDLPPRGLGLAAVHAAATVWGAMPTLEGKAVWAAIRPEVRR
ncbi:ATP-binding protein [Actinoplanes sp. NBC_00393]|uniref:ATP-binding protein n=1 Tax=Actinoplanes sp. NBC_00393 TaxID=2975953 RepID=UPI002E210072